MLIKPGHSSKFTFRKPENRYRVPFQGGIGSGISGHYNPPLDSVFRVWAGHNACPFQDSLAYQGDDYTLLHWNNCDCNSQLALYLTHDGGHSWAGGLATPIGDAPSTAINANKLMWEFFLEHRLDCPTPAVNPTGSQPKIRLYPNPTSGTVRIETDALSVPVEYKIISITGKTVRTGTLTASEALIDFPGAKKGIYFLKSEGRVARFIKY